MTRNRQSAKKAGTAFETAMESYLRWALGDARIMRLRLHGRKDVGDIGNVFFYGYPVVIECKNTATLNARQHMREAIVEAGNADSPWPWVLQKKAGVGLSSIRSLGQQLAYTQVDVFERMTADFSSSLIATITRDATILGRKGDIIQISTQQFALLLNHGLPLGPDLDKSEA